MKIYLVGGAVRDALLDLPVTERDWVVTGATPAQMSAQGFRQIDSNFPVFHHPKTGEEYALARREIKTGAGYRGFTVAADPHITLEQDLIRRDLTINAIAQDAQGKLTDPFNGQDDLRNGCLRHISPAFTEDPVRLLRVARFAAKLGHCGFRVTHATHRLMRQMVADDAIAELKPERIWREMKKALAYQQPWRFFDVLNGCGGLAQLCPDWTEAPPSHPDHTKPDHSTCHALRQACQLSDQPTVRFAALWLKTTLPDWLDSVLEKRFAQLLHDARTAWSNLAAWRGNSAENLYDFLHRHRAWRQGEQFIHVMQVLQAQSEHLVLLETINQARQVAADVDIASLKAQGFHGPALGQALAQHRIQAIQQLSPAKF